VPVAATQLVLEVVEEFKERAINQLRDWTILS